MCHDGPNQKSRRGQHDTRTARERHGAPSKHSAASRCCHTSRLSCAVMPNGLLDHFVREPHCSGADASASLESSSHPKTSTLTEHISPGQGHSGTGFGSWQPTRGNSTVATPKLGSSVVLKTDQWQHLSRGFIHTGYQHRSNRPPQTRPPPPPTAAGSPTRTAPTSRCRCTPSQHTPTPTPSGPA